MKRASDATFSTITKKQKPLHRQKSRDSDTQPIHETQKETSTDTRSTTREPYPPNTIAKKKTHPQPPQEPPRAHNYTIRNIEKAIGVAEEEIEWIRPSIQSLEYQITKEPWRLGAKNQQMTAEVQDLYAHCDAVANQLEDAKREFQRQKKNVDATTFTRNENEADRNMESLVEAQAKLAVLAIKIWKTSRPRRKKKQPS